MPSRKELANALRVLAMDAIEKAKSGHPGAPMGMADMAEALWRGPLKYNPANPAWTDRDRFILSNGHGSMLLYGVLHLTGYDLSMDDIRQFRQLGSKTPGHPEYGTTPGVELTTGPLGQGLATAVGMALAEKLLAAQFNRGDFPIVNHRTYTFAGDGCLMEGVSQEAISLAGVLGLSKLIVLYDMNGISIDGNVKDWFDDDTPARFRASGWNVIADVDGHNPEELDAALAKAAISDKPTLICCRTIIGYGAPHKAGTASCHGSPLGEEEVRAAKERLEWTLPPFEISSEIYQAWDARERGARLEQEWNALFERYKKAFPDLAADFQRRMAGELPAKLGETIKNFIAKIASEKPAIATRVAGKNTLDLLAGQIDSLFGMAADLTGSVGTKHALATPIVSHGSEGNYLSCGVREFGMAAIMNGMALHGGFIPYGGTFLVFSDYERSAIRLAALMRIRSIFVLTHDSIGVGEDGPTHQPVEHVPSLRLIPGLDVWRPCDAVETAVAWECAIRRQGPTCLIMTRQSVPTQERTPKQIENIHRGGYILFDCEGTPELILIATGSEIALAMEAAQILAGQGRAVRVVSMPCAECFDRQDAAYREKVLPSAIRARIAVEAASANYWWKYVGLDGCVVGMNEFGTSAPAKVLFQHFRFTAGEILKRAQKILK